ncbi:MAG TPA: serine/threonine-protein kinase, partial [Bacilli bacterium]
MKAVSQLNINEVLGERYRILAVLGHGGMSTVYLAEDLKLKGKKWAVKQSYYPSHDVLKFIKEAEILIKLNHSNLPHIVDYFPPVDGQSSFLVMDYIKGCTLSEIFNQLGRKLSWQKVVKYSVQLCDLFIYLHNYKPSPIIYRDLKPSNVMIDEQDCVRLIDFGIARNFEPVKTMDTIEIGTVGFAAPEQFEHKQTDQRTD